MKSAMGRWHSECPQGELAILRFFENFDEYLFAATPNQAVASSPARIAADSDECLNR